jgi:hypothetical protein
MTMFVLVVSFLALAMVGLVWGLLKLARSQPAPPAPATLPLRSIPEPDYRPMDRLFDPEDLEYLRKQRGYRPEMDRRLRLARRAALQLYLRRVHEDFRQSWTVSRGTGALEARAETSAASFFKDVAVFYSLYVTARLQCALARFTYTRVDPSGLLAVLQRAHAAERTATAGPPPELPAIARGR